MPDEKQWSSCQGCGGTGYVEMPRAYVTSDGQVTTRVAAGRCLHCRGHPGRQPGSGSPA